MPGIFGVFAGVSEDELSGTGRRMRSHLRHQPWYDGFLHTDGRVCLGALSTSPRFSDTRNYCVIGDVRAAIEGNAMVVDGEAVPPDAEGIARRIIHLYQLRGDDFVHYLSGSFNVALFDARQERLLICNDRFGFSSLLYHENGNTLLFAPELKAFLAYPQLDKTLDESAVALFLSGDGIVGDRTFLKRVKVLPPASRLEFQQGSLKVAPYWRAEFEANHARTRESFEDEGLELYRRSLWKQLPAAQYRRIAFPLSGGLDSRLMLRLLSEKHDRPRLFTFGQNACLDWRYARRTAAACDLSERHSLLEIRSDWDSALALKTVWLNDGQVSFGNAHQIGIAQAIGPGRVPFINGIPGAGMSLGPGCSYVPDDIGRLTDPQKIRERLFATLGFPAAHRQFRRYLTHEAALEFRALSHEAAWEEFANHRHNERFCDQISTFIQFDINRRVTFASNLFRYYFHDVMPFVDYDLFELSTVIPPGFKLKHLLYQDMFKRHFADLAAIPWTHTGHDLYARPAAIFLTNCKRRAFERALYGLRRLSRGHLDSANRDDYLHREIWLRRDSRARRTMFAALANAGDTDLGWFDQGRIDRLLGGFMQGRDELFATICKLFTFLTWHRLFIGEEYRVHDLCEDVRPYKLVADTQPAPELDSSIRT